MDMQLAGGAGACRRLGRGARCSARSAQESRSHHARRAPRARRHGRVHAYQGPQSLGQVVQVDPSVLESENVRSGIDHDLNDVSPQTRDAAVDLVGKYVLDSPSVLKDYFPLLINRIIVRF